LIAAARERFAGNDEGARFEIWIGKPRHPPMAWRRGMAYDCARGARTNEAPISFSRKEDLMYAAIRQAKAKTGTAEELARRIKEGAIPIVSDVEGFMAYYVVYAPDDTVTAISIFNKYEEAEEANRRMIAWIEQDLGPLLTGPASAVAGPVIVHTLA
jgi:hypothetical protein